MSKKQKEEIVDHTVHDTDIPPPINWERIAEERDAEIEALTIELENSRARNSTITALENLLIEALPHVPMSAHYKVLRSRIRMILNLRPEGEVQGKIEY